MRRQQLFILITWLGLGVSGIWGFDGARFISHEDQDKDIEEITIRHSGFLKDDKLTIRFRSEDQEIVEVIENGRSLPPETFHRYESKLRQFLEFRTFERMTEDMSRLETEMEALEEAEFERFEALEDLSKSPDKEKLKKILEQLADVARDTYQKTYNYSNLQSVEEDEKEKHKIDVSNN